LEAATAVPAQKNLARLPRRSSRPLLLRSAGWGFLELGAQESVNAALLPIYAGRRVNRIDLGRRRRVFGENAFNLPSSISSG